MAIDGIRMLPPPVASAVSGVLDVARFTPGQDAAPAGPAQLADAIREAFQKLFDRAPAEGGRDCSQRPEPFGLEQGQQQQLQGIDGQLSEFVQKLGDLLEGLQSGKPGEWGDPHVEEVVEDPGEWGDPHVDPNQKQPGAAQRPLTLGQVVKVLEDMMSKLTGQASQKGFDPQPEPPSPGSLRGFDPQPDPPAAFGDGSVRPVETSASDSVSAGGAKIDGMMKEAERLMQSDNKADQLKGQKMMQDAQNMFSMLSNLIKAQGDMQKAAIQNMRG